MIIILVPLLALIFTTHGSSLPPLPLVPYPQNVTLLQALPAVIDPRLFRFTTHSDSLLLQEVFERYHRYLNLHDFIQERKATLPSLYVVVDNESADLELSTSENYTLVVTTESAVLKADTVFAAMRGLETFSQLINTYNYTLPSVNIVDFPRYKFRGFMMDTSRHYLSVSVLKQLIRAASWSKLNVFHWHIVDDPSFPYCSTEFPELCVKGAYSPAHIYSQEDVMDIILFAYRHGVIVIPELDTPGHTLSWGKALPGFLTHCPGAGNIGSDYGAIDPTNEAVYSVIERLFKEVTGVFPAEFVHLGGDEVRYKCWQSNENISSWMSAHNMSGKYEQLENYYETRLLKIVNSLNKNYIVWEEVYGHHLDITPQTIIHAWRPDWQKVLSSATKAGYRCILSSCWYISRITYGDDWKDFYQCDPRSFNESATFEEKQLVLGGTICMWGEYVDNTNVLQRTWPRASAPAERLWSPANLKDPNFMKPRIDAHRCRMIYRGFPAEPAWKRGFCQVEYKWRM